MKSSSYKQTSIYYERIKNFVNTVQVISDLNKLNKNRRRNEESSYDYIFREGSNIVEFNMTKERRCLIYTCKQSNYDYNDEFVNWSVIYEIVVQNERTSFRLNGIFNIYYKHSNIIEITGSAFKKMLTGCLIIFHKNEILKCSIPIDNNKITGMVIKYSETGFVQERTEYSRNFKDGNSIKYLKDYIIYSKFKKNRLNGLFVVTTADGKKVQEIIYDNDRQIKITNYEHVDNNQIHINPIISPRPYYAELPLLNTAVHASSEIKYVDLNEGFDQNKQYYAKKRRRLNY